jgi:hypothetical protein
MSWWDPFNWWSGGKAAARTPGLLAAGLAVVLVFGTAVVVYVTKPWRPEEPVKYAALWITPDPWPDYIIFHQKFTIKIMKYRHWPAYDGLPEAEEFITPKGIPLSFNLQCDPKYASIQGSASVNTDAEGEASVTVQSHAPPDGEAKISVTYTIPHLGKPTPFTLDGPKPFETH